MIEKAHFKRFPALETERLILRKFDLADAERLQSLRSNPEVMRYMDTTSHASVEDSRAFISKNFVAMEEEKGLFWAMEEKASGLFIGDFSFWSIDHKNARAEIGYTLLPEAWGKGYMSEAMRALFHFGFNDLNLHSFEANINPQNDNSRQILKKLGFEKEAYFRENYYYNGVFLDSEIYCLLKTDFIAAQK